ncbi:MAG: SIMPL domain-containing protein [Anaerolineae bacterium]|nr:SIMPL domain-containing protein [Anaerolineae bacterium]
MFKRVMLLVAVVALLVPVGLAGVWLWGQVSGPAVAQESTETEYSPAQTITVVGQGSVRVQPDIARVSLGVETRADTISEGLVENGEQMEAILAALAAAGIDDSDIQTSNFSISLDRYPEPFPQVEGAEGEESQPVYRISNMVNVTIRDLDTVGDVLDAVVEAGANNIWGVSFTLEEPSAAEAEARVDAIADAQQRAAALAELTEVQLGPVMSVSEIISGGSFPVSSVVERAALAADASISPGELEITYQVQVSYFIER